MLCNIVLPFKQHLSVGFTDIHGQQVMYFNDCILIFSQMSQQLLDDLLLLLEQAFMSLQEELILEILQLYIIRSNFQSLHFWFVTKSLQN